MIRLKDWHQNLDPVANIDEIQREIVEEFQVIGEDREQALEYLMEVGLLLDSYPEDARTEEHLIKGCQSKVWLNAELNDGKVGLWADSNTAITKGLISLLLRVYNHMTPSQIINSEPWFLKEIGMDNLIGSQRSNGLTSMISEIKKISSIYQSLETSKNG